MDAQELRDGRHATWSLLLAGTVGGVPVPRVPHQYRLVRLPAGLRGMVLSAQE